MGQRVAPGRRLRASILDMMLLVAAIAVSLRCRDLSMPVALLFLYAFTRRRAILTPRRCDALGLVALALYLPPAALVLFEPVEWWGDYLEHFSCMPGFVPAQLLARVLPGFDRNHEPLFTVPMIVLSITITLGEIVVFGILAARGKAWRIACLVLASMMSAASSFLTWVLLHAGA